MTERKRIAFIRPNTWPLANTEVEAQIRKHFSGHEVDVLDIKPLVWKHPGIVIINGLWTLLLYGVDIVFGIKNLRQSFWHTPYIFRAIKRLVKTRFSGSDYLFSFQMQSLFDCSLPGIPHFVYTDHTHLANLSYPDSHRSILFSQKWIELEKQIYNNATITFVRSSNIRQSLIEQYHYPPERTICVYAGNNITIVDNPSRQKHYIDKNILYVGIDWKRKGGPELVYAFEEVMAQHPDAKLTIVGASPKINLPNCTILGRIPPAEVAQYYKKATIFCMPTHLEPFGIAFLEAMQARLPIVATNVGAIPDFVKNEWNGYLVEPGDVQGIAKALEKLLSNPAQRREFGERGFSLAQERYSWDAVGRRIHQYIDEKLV